MCTAAESRRFSWTPPFKGRSRHRSVALSHVSSFLPCFWPTASSRSDHFLILPGLFLGEEAGWSDLLGLKCKSSQEFWSWALGRGSSWE